MPGELADRAPSSTGPLVDVRDVVIEMGHPGSDRRVTRIGPVSFTVDRGTCLGLVGRSGAGKSTLALALLGMLPPQGRLVEGTVTVAGHALFALDEPALRGLRGKTMAMIFQDPASALNPVRRLDRVFGDVLRAHGTTARQEVLEQSAEALRQARLDPDLVLRRYPHELSGGMRQRVLVALAICNAPDLLVADEPTTALDPTIQLEVLDLLGDLRRSNTLVVITHDLRVARRLCDTVAVMEQGRVVEHGPVADVLVDPRHEVTRALLADEGGAAIEPARAVAGDQPARRPAPVPQPRGTAAPKR